VMVVGPTDSGKTSLCRTLVAWATRMGWSPLMVDLDPGQQDLTVPGAIGAVAVNRASLAVDEAGVAGRAVSFFAGGASPADNQEAFRAAMRRLASVTVARASRFADEAVTELAARASSASSAAPLDWRVVAADPPAAACAAAGGMVINWSGFVDVASVGYVLLMQAARWFNVDVVLVVGSERLQVALTKDLSVALPDAAFPPSSASSASSASSGSAAITVTSVPRSGGVVERSQTARRESRNARVEAYFYGPSSGSVEDVAQSVRDRLSKAGVAASLSPADAPPPHPAHQVSLTPSSKTLRLATSAGASSSAPVTLVRLVGTTSSAAHVPLDAASALTALQVEPITVLSKRELEGHVLGVSFAATNDDVPHVPLAGFLHVTAVDEDKQTLVVLAPTAEPLPANILVLTPVVWRP
jgi:polyribonucleotide 5'-hydroxyl-kinase